MSPRSNTVRIATGAALLIIASTVGVILKHTTYAHLRFEFNWSVIVYGLTALLMATVLVILAKKGTRSHITFWYSVFTISAIFTMVGGLLSGMSLDNATYTAVYPVTSLSSIFTVLTGFFFVLAYTGYEDYLYRPLTWLAFLGSGFALFYTDSATHFFDNPAAVARTSVGYPLYAQQGRYYGIYSMWLLIFLAYRLTLTLMAQATAQRAPLRWLPLVPAVG